MNLKELLSSLTFDHASSWIHVFNLHFYTWTPSLMYLPDMQYNKALATVSLIAFIHICFNLSQFFRNKQKAADRRERARLNRDELRKFLDETLVYQSLGDVTDEITDMAFDEITRKIKDGSLNPVSVVVAFQKKALLTSKANAVAEFIWNQDGTMSTPTDPTTSETDALFGIPISFSELIDLHEKDRTLGFGGNVGITAKSDAHIVKLLKASKAVPFMRTNVTQADSFCPSLVSSNPIFGRTWHPHGGSRSSGGGSCGEACALALGASLLGVGGDLVGGVRVPAHFCGVAALRTTPQRLSIQGVIQGQSLVSTCVGPMAREVSSLVAFMRSVCGSRLTDLAPSDPEKPFDEEVYSSTKHLRIGFYVEDGYTRTTPAVSRSIREAQKYLEKRGHKLVQFSPPDMLEMMSALVWPAAMGPHQLLWQMMSLDSVDPGLRRIYYSTQANNAVRWLFSWWRHTQSPMEAALEASSLPISMEDWWRLTHKVQDFRTQFNQRWKLARLDAMLCPVMPCAAVKVGNEHRCLACLTHVGLFSLLNYPAGTVPITKVTEDDLLQFQSSSSYLPLTSLDRCILQDQVGDENDMESSVLGFPIGVQVAALPFHEEIVLRVMRILEEGRKRTSEFALLSSFRGSFTRSTQITPKPSVSGKTPSRTLSGANASPSDGFSFGRRGSKRSESGFSSRSRRSESEFSSTPDHHEGSAQNHDAAAGRVSDGSKAAIPPPHSPSSSAPTSTDEGGDEDGDPEDKDYETVPVLTVSVSRIKSAVKGSASRVGSAIRGSIKKIASSSSSSAGSPRTEAAATKKTSGEAGTVRQSADGTRPSAAAAAESSAGLFRKASRSASLAKSSRTGSSSRFEATPGGNEGGTGGGGGGNTSSEVVFAQTENDAPNVSGKASIVSRSSKTSTFVTAESTPASKSD